MQTCVRFWLACEQVFVLEWEQVFVPATVMSEGRSNVLLENDISELRRGFRDGTDQRESDRQSEAGARYGRMLEIRER